MASLQEARAKMKEHFAGDSSGQGDRWSALWDKGDFLPWDRGMPNPALQDALVEKKEILGSPLMGNEMSKEDAAGMKPIKRKRALVPGCGRGYDVLLLASFGYDAYGVEVSESAVKRCKEEQQESKYPVHDETVGAGEATFVVGDFFAENVADGLGPAEFDLIYDYTFLCAIPPSLRPKWALQMSRLLKPDGHLVCLEFPTNKDPSLGGPPFALPSAVYLALLAEPGKQLVYDETGHFVAPASQHEPIASSVALKRVAHWKPARTHEIGKDQDWMSIWRHAV